MELSGPSVVSRVKELKTLEAIRADPSLGPFERNVYPLTGQLRGAPRAKTKTLGEGSFGRVNLEALAEGNIATKYFTTDIDTNVSDSLGEIIAMKYTEGLPNITPLIGLEDFSANTSPLEFPALALGKAETDLGKAKFTNWKDLYSVCLQVLRGYFTLHSMKIVHRDTKPANMLLTSYKEVWISDLGKAKYIDAPLPPPADNYCGTYWYASPEGLMKFQGHPNRIPFDSFKNDCWAVGASLYNILTGTPFTTGESEADCIEGIFLRKGTPLPTDGEVYTLYQSWPMKAGVDLKLVKTAGAKTILQNPDAITNRLLTRIRIPGVDTAILKQIGKVLSGLMEYNPMNRLTIAEALLQMPGVSALPPPLSPPSIAFQATALSTFPNDITATKIDSYLNYVSRVVMTMDSTKSFPFVLDRTGLYIYSFLHYYKENPYCQEANLHTIIITASLLALSLFSTEAEDLDLQDFVYELSGKDRKTKKAKILECLRMYIVSDIQFYGRTLLDEVVQSLPSFHDEEAQMYGFLNYICYQKNLFHHYTTTLDILRDEILEFVKDGRMPRKQYLKEFRKGMGADAKTNSMIQDFVDYATPSEGGRRRYKKSRRVKRRRHNTTLKVRNG